MKIVFFGTSSFAARVLEKLLEQTSYEVVAIVTRPDRAKGRNLKLAPSSVKKTALELAPHIPLFQPEKASTDHFAKELEKLDADLFVVVAYGEIIKENILKIPRLTCINIHASLLPKLRGAAPIQRALMQGEPQTGITIIEMTPQMDAGDILAIEAISIPENMTFKELDEELCALSVKLLFQVIRAFETNTIVKIPQDHTHATFAPKLRAEEEKINWNLPARQIHNQIRALSPSPGAWCLIQLGSETKRLKILQSEVVEDVSQEPGKILHFGKDGWVIACGNNALRLFHVQLEGKKSMTAKAFVCGVHQNIPKMIQKVTQRRD